MLNKKHITFYIALCLFVYKSYGQLGFCNGNSGDPIFTETFGTGIGNNSLPTGTTTYNYTSGFPNDGFYTVSNGTMGSNFDWHQIPDHTFGDINGKLLVVNAATTAGEFYQTTVTGLCPNTPYEFSAWVINLGLTNTFCGAGIIPINVKFEIRRSSDNGLIVSGDTGSISATSRGNPLWEEYGLVFRTGAETSVVLKMINNGNGGCGNDLAIDDIEFKSCGDLTVIQDSSTSNNICEFQTPYATNLTAVPDNFVFSTHFYQWQESSDGVNWVDILGETNQSIAVSGIVNTTYYRTKVSESAGTLNNSKCNTLSEIYEIIVDPIITPTFTQVSAICNGDLLTALPTTSLEGVRGKWSPAIDNTVTTTYTFTPDSGQCANNLSMTIGVNSIITPTFVQVSDVCSGENLFALPGTSLEGITGSWSPVIDNTTTTTYTFTPDSGQCANSQTMTIVVNPTVLPTFLQVDDICEGETLSALPTMSLEGINGVWSPALDNTATTTYTFFPSLGQCSQNQSMTITVNPLIAPTFTQVGAICNGDSLAALPTTSIEGITGTWSPTIDNTLTTSYTFTPDIDQCSLSQTMTIEVNANQAPVFNQVPPICKGDFLSPLPLVSSNGVSGTWLPAINNLETTTYTFTPDIGFCPLTVNLTIEVFDIPEITLENEYFLCFNTNGNLDSSVILDTGLSTANYIFIWFLNGNVISGAEEGNYSPIASGTYEVIVQNINTGCFNNFSTLVTSLFEPEFEAQVTTEAFIESQIIEVLTLSNGDFEFKLDDGNWQDESVFNNVYIGEHQVFVRDKRGCVERKETVMVMGYPKFFTPNGDSFNDTWNIVAPTTPVNYLASAKVYIYDRYGKLMKQLNPEGSGWKGTYKGVDVPSDDYWFIVEYNEPTTDIRKEFRAHFTLKR